MGNLGFGVMLRALSGNEETVRAFTGAVNKIISSARVAKDVDELQLRFTDGTGILVFDDGQSCCESRYMRTDDDLSQASGATFLGLDIKDAPGQEDEYGDAHDIQFLELQTSLGPFTMSNHNVHNGYYGGFAVVVRELLAEDTSTDKEG
jgi:hypothetical protein